MTNPHNSMAHGRPGAKPKKKTGTHKSGHPSQSHPIRSPAILDGSMQQYQHLYPSAQPLHSQEYHGHDSVNHPSYPTTGHFQSPGRESNSNWSCLFIFLMTLSYITSICLGVLILVGCISTNIGVDKLYIAEFHTNQTHNLSLRFGYFGGCVTVSDITGPSNTTIISGTSSNISSSEPQTHCVGNMRTEDVDDLNEEFWENLDLTTEAQEYVKMTLNTTLPVVKHLQEDVFFWMPPVVHFILFVISGIMLLTALTGASSKRRYKTVLMVATLLGAFSISLALVTAIGSLQGLNSILDGAKSKSEQLIGSNIYLSRANRLDHVQASLAAIAALFYISMGILFVRRKHEGSQNIFQVFQTSHAAIRPFLKR